MLTVHCLALQGIVPVVFGEEELEVALWICDASDLIFVVDKVACDRLATRKLHI